MARVRHAKLKGWGVTLQMLRAEDIETELDGRSLPSWSLHSSKADKKIKK